MKVVLELQDQPSNVRRITIRHDIVIGRGSDCNLRLSAPQVSRRHCFLRVGRDSVSITDLDSSNGTFIDGQRIAAGKRCAIADGVQLALGPIRFIVHVRADRVVADTAKRKSQAGFTSAFPGADAGRDSDAQHELTDDSSTIDGRSLAAKSRGPLDYAVGHSDDSTERDEVTEGHLENQFAFFGSAEFFPSDPDPMDSRLEIVDFGRRLSEESSSIEETRSVFSSRNTGKPDLLEEGDPQWASGTIEYSELPEDVDVLSIADDSGVNCDFEDERSLKAATSSGNAGEDRCIRAEEVREIDEDVDVAEGLLEAGGQSNWFSDGDADSDNQPDRPNAAADMDAGDQADENAADTNLPDFLKGY